MTKTKRLLATVAAAAGVLALATAPQASADEQAPQGSVPQSVIANLHLIPAHLAAGQKHAAAANSQADPPQAYLIPSGANSGRCLDADLNTIGANGTKVQLWDCDLSAANQAFYITRIPEGYLRFQNVQSGRYLDADSNTIGANGTKVQLWDYVPGAQNQWWGDSEIPEGYTRFLNPASGRYLDADSNTIGANGTRVQLWDYTPAAKNQWWGAPPA